MQKATKIYGGSGGGLPVGSLKPIVSGRDLVSFTDGSTWIRTGKYVADTDELYPGAPVNTFDSGIGGSVAIPSNMRGIALGGGFLWVTTSQAIKQYGEDGVATGVTLNIAAQTTTASGIEWVEGELWVCNTADQNIYKYDPSGITYLSTGTLGDAVITGPRDLAYDQLAGVIWLVGGATVARSYHIDDLSYAVGIALGADFTSTEAKGIAIVGGYYWVNNTGDDRIYKFAADATAILDQSAGSVSMYGMTNKNNQLWFTDDTADVVEKWIPYVGGPTIKTHVETGVVYYTRIA